MTTKTSRRLTLRDRLSRLTDHRACRLLGPEGKRLLQAGSYYDSIDIDRDVSLPADR